jgi:cytoskeletal protein CcmA (bactofilin family)
LFNKEPLFGQRDESGRTDQRATNTAAGLTGTSGVRAQGLAQAYSKPPEPVPAAPVKAAEEVEESAGSKLIVGPDIKLKGVEITDCDTLVVEGRVEASMDSRVVQIAQHGIFAGKATMDVAEIWGTFEGQLTVRKHLVIYSTGRVSGLIRYGKIRIEEGGELSGDVSTLAAKQAAPHAPEPHAAALAGSQAKEAPVDALSRTARPPAKSGVTVN